MMSAASHSRAAVRLSTADPELERFRLITLALVLGTPPHSERATGWQGDLALRWRSECEHSSLADAAGRRDGGWCG
eukprot:683907-Prymnesium_polylepis.1